VGGEYGWFVREIYEHTTAMPEHSALVGEAPGPVRMGNFSPLRLPDSVAREIWKYFVDLGLRAPIFGGLSASRSTGNDVIYTLHVQNRGVASKGLTAEQMTVSVALPLGMVVVTAEGGAYEGLHKD